MVSGLYIVIYRYNTVQYSTILYAELQWIRLYTVHHLNSQITPHTSPSWATYGVYTVCLTCYNGTRLCCSVTWTVCGYNSIRYIFAALLSPTVRVVIISQHAHSMRLRKTAVCSYILRVNLEKIHYGPGVGVTKPISSVPIFSQFFQHRQNTY